MVEITWLREESSSTQLHHEPTYLLLEICKLYEQGTLKIDWLTISHSRKVTTGSQDYHTREVITTTQITLSHLGQTSSLLTMHQTFSLVLFYSPEALLLLSMIDMTMSHPWLNRAVQVQPSVTSVFSSPAHGVTAHCHRHSTVLNTPSHRLRCS